MCGYHLNVHTVAPFPIPADCTDGFAGAYWRRLEAYLESAVRGSISSLALLSPEDADKGARRMREDLEPGAWDACYGYLRKLPEIDLGYRLVVAGSSNPLTPFIKGDYGSIRSLSWTLHFPRNNLNCSSGCGG